MRLIDMLTLPLGAMFQQKLRTGLTMLGVVFGSFVLAASMSINEGVQETIRRESNRNDMLRRVSVRPDWRPAESERNPRDYDVGGTMSDERRERIRQGILAQKDRSRASQPRLPLNSSTLTQLSRLEHVTAVVPVVGQAVVAHVDHRLHDASLASARPQDEATRQRIVAGRFFDSPSEQGAVVSELLLHRCGFMNEAEQNGVIGKTLRLELTVSRPEAGFSLQLNKASGADPTSEESTAVDEIRRQLPERLGFFNLSQRDIELMMKVLHERSPAAAEEVVAEFPIIGVVRLPTEEELKGPRDPLQVNTDIVLAYETASEFYFRSGSRAASGLDQAVLLVDDEMHVKEVLEKARSLNLNANAPIEFIERTRLLYSLIFGGMTCVAAVALLVAALGIANTMLMSVLERTREIGIMKAVGAGNGQLIFIFVVEGGLIGLVGGGLGMLLAWTASYPGDEYLRTHVSSDVQVFLKEAVFIFPPWLTATVMLFAVLVTTAAAVYPARQAARIDPVAALRHE